MLEAGGRGVHAALLAVLQVHHAATGGSLAEHSASFGEAAAQVDVLALLALGTAWLDGRRRGRSCAGAGACWAGWHWLAGRG